MYYLNYHNDYVECPKCKTDRKSKKCLATFKSNYLESLSLVCVNCGLKLSAEKRVWKIDNSYIDKSIINKKLDPTEKTDIFKNENIITGFLDIV